LAHCSDAAAQVEPLRPCGRGEQLVERRRLTLGKSQEVALCGGMQAAQTRQDLVPDQPALRLAVRRIRSEIESLGLTVRLRLLPPDGQQRAYDSILAKIGRASCRERE